MSSNTLQQAIALAKSGDKAGARQLLESILQHEPNNETAWIWMTDVVESDYERRICLEKVLSINPGNLIAKEGLHHLGIANPSPTVPTTASSQPEGPLALSRAVQGSAQPSGTKPRSVSVSKRQRPAWFRAPVIVLAVMSVWFGSLMIRNPTSPVQDASVARDSKSASSSATATLEGVQYGEMMAGYDQLSTELQKEQYVQQFEGREVHWRLYVSNVTADAVYLDQEYNLVKDVVFWLVKPFVVLEGVPDNLSIKLTSGQEVTFRGTIERFAGGNGFGIQTHIKWSSFDP